jgi:hypothetical protein
MIIEVVGFFLFVNCILPLPRAWEIAMHLLEQRNENFLKCRAEMIF